MVELQVGMEDHVINDLNYDSSDNSDLNYDSEYSSTSDEHYKEYPFILTAFDFNSEFRNTNIPKFVAKNLDIEWCRMVKMTQKSFMLIIEFLA